MEKDLNEAEQDLIAAYRVMQPAPLVVDLARGVGGGALSKHAQLFVFENCIEDQVCKTYPPGKAYVGSVLKHLILAAESEGQEVLDELYTLHSSWLQPMEGTSDLSERCYKTFSFIIPEEAKKILVSNKSYGGPVESKDEGLVTLRLSLNILEGGTGCSIWPAGLFLSEFMLTYPRLFYQKPCLELGSGTGLMGVWLSRLGSSKVSLTDGDLAVVDNMRHNLNINGVLNSSPENSWWFAGWRKGAPSVACRQLVWETATPERLMSFSAEIIVGADLIYDPVYVPHLVRVFSELLKDRTTSLETDEGDDGEPFEWNLPRPVAYLATTLRNKRTTDLFFSSASMEGLEVVDVTESMRPSVCLREIHGFDRSQVRLHRLSSREVKRNATA